jgi:hypothetical protein
MKTNRNISSYFFFISVACDLVEKEKKLKGKKRKKRIQVKKNKVALVSSFYINEKHIEENIMLQELTAHTRNMHTHSTM